MLIDMPMMQNTVSTRVKTKWVPAARSMKCPITPNRAGVTTSSKARASVLPNPLYKARVVSIDSVAPSWRSRIADGTPVGSPDHDGPHVVAVVGDDGIRAQPRQHHAPRPQDDPRPPVPVAQAHEPVMEVLLVGVGHAAAAGGPPDHREQGVEHRHAQDEE